MNLNMVSFYHETEGSVRTTSLDRISLPFYVALEWTKDYFKIYWLLLVAQTVKNLPAMRETWVRSQGGKDPQRREWQPPPVFLPGEFHGQRNLVGWLQYTGLQRVGRDWVTNTFTIRTTVGGGGLVSPSCPTLVIPCSLPGGLLHCRQILYQLNHQGSPLCK